MLSYRRISAFFYQLGTQGRPVAGFRGGPSHGHSRPTLCVTNPIIARHQITRRRTHDALLFDYVFIMHRDIKPLCKVIMLDASQLCHVGFLCKHCAIPTKLCINNMCVWFRECGLQCHNFFTREVQFLFERSICQLIRLRSDGL